MTRARTLARISARPCHAAHSDPPPRGGGDRSEARLATRSAGLRCQSALPAPPRGGGWRGAAMVGTRGRSLAACAWPRPARAGLLATRPPLGPGTTSRVRPGRPAGRARGPRGQGDHRRRRGPRTLPGPVSFRDLWDHPDDWRGRRVTVRGTVARVFRQGAVGSFPPLVEAWLSTPGGRPFLRGLPPAGAGGPEATARSSRARTVDFTGTFLKTDPLCGGRPAAAGPADRGRSAAGPGRRGAPARDRPRRPCGRSGPARSRIRRPLPVADSWSAAGWALGLVLGLAAAAVLAWQHLAEVRPRRRSSSRQSPTGAAQAEPSGRAGADAPPEFRPHGARSDDRRALRDPSRD